MIIGLRHDVDTVYGLRLGLPKIISIERRYKLRSTFFVRVDIIRTKKDAAALRKLLDEGWEIGLHLINTDCRPSLIFPMEEMTLLQSHLETTINGVTYCGSTIGWKGEDTWNTMDGLNLQYMEGYGNPKADLKTFVMPLHLSLDIHYVRKFGEEEGYNNLREDLLHELNVNDCATVLVHPEWFVRSVGGHGLIKIPLTLLRIKMMNKIYDRFLRDFKNKVKFMKYIDLFNILTKK